MRLTKTVPFTLKPPRTLREKKGVKYEKKVHEKLIEEFGLYYIPNQWFAYGLRGATRFCQPDGILLQEQKKLILVVEVKYSHTPDSFWQLEHVYLPVIRAFILDASWRIAKVEVVKWFDPAVHCPVRPVLRENLRDVRPGEFAVHILNR